MMKVEMKKIALLLTACTLSLTLTTHAAEAVKTSLAKLESNDAWTFRQIEEYPHKKSKQSVTQFNVLFISYGGGAPIEAITGDITHIIRDNDPLIAHRAILQPPRMACLLDTFAFGSGQLKRAGPCPYPLEAGLAWDDDISGKDDVKPWAIHYVVDGTEEVTVPAGTFTATKISSVMTRFQSRLPSQPQSAPAVVAKPDIPNASDNTSDTAGENKATMQSYVFNKCTSWYAPKAKLSVKSTCEFFDDNGAFLSMMRNELFVYEVH